MQCVVVVGFNQRVPGGIGGAVGHGIHGYQRGKDRFAELAHDHHFVHREAHGFCRGACWLGGMGLVLRADSNHHAVLHRLDLPDLLQRPLSPADQIAPARLGLGQRQQLRQMVLEHQPELPARRGGLPFSGQPLAQSRVADLADQIVDG
ncbi:MAG: hypothetical protein ABS92_02635 [Thiobacillus sp. SCN 63-374]|nr:MAG: hypothetical protein ABS92_02635 [Thiobacillus sp. SCN 63-374]